MMLLATVFVACSDDDDEKDDDKPTDKVKLVSKIVTSSSEGIDRALHGDNTYKWFIE